MEDGRDSLSGLNGDGGLFDNDLGGLGDLSDATGRELPVGEICSTASADANLLGWGVDGDEDNVSLLDGGVDVGGEEEVAAAAGLDYLVEPRLVDGQVCTVPGGDAGFGYVDYLDLDFWAFEGDY